MASEVGIANRALIKLGADTLLALTDDTTAGRTMNTSYGPVRDAEFHRHRWRFSIKRIGLAASSTAPASDYPFQYQVPSDYLRLIEGGDIRALADLSDYRTFSSALYSVEGDKILTSLTAPLNIRYIARITDVALFNPSFAEALSSRLAYESCERITQSDAKKEAAFRDYRLAILEATRANALEAPPQGRIDDSWMLARAQ